MKKFLSYYKPYLSIFIADMVFALLLAGVSLLIPVVTRYVTSTVIYMEKESAQIELFKVIGVFVILLVIAVFSNYFICYYGHMMGAKIEFNMRKEIFSHYQKLSFSFYDNEKVGQLMSRITSDLFDISELLHHGPEDIIISIIKFVGTFIILLYINKKLALVACAIIPVMFIYALILNRKMKRAFKRNRVKLADINSAIEDNLSGIRVVKSFANEGIEEEKFDIGNQGFLDSKRDSYRYMGAYHGGLFAFTNMITIIVVISGGFFITESRIDISDLLTFILYINNFIEPVNKLVNFTESFQNGITGFERFLEILSINPDITDDNAIYFPDKLEGNIVFKDVSFRYEGTTNYVLSNVNLNVKKGEYIALVGFSGAGKTTICNLIPRFYEATSGQILVDDMDIKEIKLENLRNNIGVVQQEVYLFAGTVFENILYGKPDSTKEEVINAAKNANAHEFIMNLPNGYDTYIGQRGVKLSGGQKQRLSIARVFLKNPPILIFDEATSALDNESEKIVQDSLEKLAKNRTTFVIAHRLSTIKNAQKIIVLTENGIVEEGKHKELLEKGGYYYQLYNM